MRERIKLVVAEIMRVNPDMLDRKKGEPISRVVQEIATARQMYYGLISEFYQRPNGYRNHLMAEILGVSEAYYTSCVFKHKMRLTMDGYTQKYLEALNKLM